MWDKDFKGRYILIEPTDYCNCNCIMCTRALLNIENPHNVPRGFMDFDVFKGIIDSLEFGNTPLAIKLFWIGESLLHPEFRKMLGYAAQRIKGKRAYIDLHTNATLLTKPMMDFMLTLGDTLPRVTFSLDAIREETHRKIRRGGDFKRAMSNLLYFLEEREKRHLLFPRFVYQFIVMDENAHECKSFVDYWSSVLNKWVKLTLAEAWPLLSPGRKTELLKQNGIYEKFMKLENET